MTKTQICATLGLLLTLGSSIGYADGLQALGEQDLQEVTGQGGADLSLVLRLNHTNTNPNNFDDPLNAQSNCVDLVYCRLAISSAAKGKCTFEGRISGDAVGSARTAQSSGSMRSLLASPKKDQRPPSTRTVILPP